VLSRVFILLVRDRIYTSRCLNSEVIIHPRTPVRQHRQSDLIAFCVTRARDRTRHDPDTLADRKTSPPAYSSAVSPPDELRIYHRRCTSPPHQFHVHGIDAELGATSLSTHGTRRSMRARF
jgi:hypothetical protein